MTRVEQEVIEILHEAQESFGSAAAFAQMMASYVCPKCGSRMTVGGGRSATANLNFADACLNLAARAGAVNAQLQQEIYARERELIALRAEIAQIRGERVMMQQTLNRLTPETTPSRYQPVVAETRRLNAPAEPRHAFNEQGLCASCGDGRGSMRGCPGKPDNGDGDKKDRFQIIEID